MQADFMKMPFPDNSFDGIYAIEATCHAPDAVLLCLDVSLTYYGVPDIYKVMSDVGYVS